MAKRAAAVQLTADNADIDEESAEAPGKFEQATEDQLQKRVIKKAVRRGGGAKLGEMDNDGGIFAGLKGSLGGGGGIKNSQLLLQPTANNTSKPPASVSSSLPQLSAAHLYQLKSLNTSVNEWIGHHVRENPYIDLTPIFRDYENHLRNIDKKYSNAGSDGNGSAFGSQEETESSQESEASTLREERKTEVDDEQVVMTTDEGESQPTINNEESTQESQTSATDSQSEDVDTSNQPPLSSSITEDDESSLLKTRAKLFYKKESEFTELGVGTLRVQSSSNSTVRLLLRNDTTLRTVLLNVRVSCDVPLSTNKNNVLIVCTPNPPLRKGEEPGGGAPVTYLIRVKTAEQAEQLMTCIKENTE